MSSSATHEVHVLFCFHYAAVFKHTGTGNSDLLANLEIPFPSSALAACDCSFEDGLCTWVQGGRDELDWLSRSGPTEAPNTGPAGDHTTGKGHYYSWTIYYCLLFQRHYKFVFYALSDTFHIKL